MTPPKCRICGAREHNHRCQGGTPAQQVAEQQRLRADARRREAGPRARWHDDSDAAGEPTEVRDTSHRPARFYAPVGQCVYCDRRREAARRSMASVRERGTDA